MNCFQSTLILKQHYVHVHGQQPFWRPLYGPAYGPVYGPAYWVFMDFFKLEIDENYSMGLEYISKHSDTNF